ncbi:hypothetical protein [Nonomuraea sp. NPDC002799]
MDDGTPARAMPGQVMSDEAVGRLLCALADGCRQAWTAQAEASRQLDESSAASHQPGEHTEPGLLIDPRRALAHERTLLAEDVVAHQYRTARRFIAWWVDMAICAVVSAVCGTPLTVARAVAGDPSQCLEAEELALLPPIPKEDRQLAQLALDMDEGLPADPSRAGMALVGGHAFAAEIGLSVKHTSFDGQAVLVEDGAPEARRRRLWGQTWMVYQMPPLPETKGLLQTLEEIGVPPAVMSDVKAASDAVDAALRARVRAVELEERDGLENATTEDALDAEATELWGRYDRLPDLLMDYARCLTGHLPALRNARAMSLKAH